MSMIPLDDDDLFKIARLAFAWECTPEAALKRCLADSVAAEFDPPDDYEVLHEIRAGEVTEHHIPPAGNQGNTYS